MYPLPHPISKRAFTLLELIVVIVVLGILAAIAVPTFARVIEKSEDEATLTSLRAAARELQALEAFDRDGFDRSDVEAVGADMNTATAPGVLAVAVGPVIDYSVMSLDPEPGQLVYLLQGDGVVLSSRSGSGNVCAVGVLATGIGDGVCEPDTSEDEVLPGILAATGSVLYPAGASVPTPPSAPSQPEAPQLAAPSAPTGVTAVPGNGAASVSFTPSADGGAAAKFVVTSSPGGIKAETTGTSVTVAPLTNGTSYTFTVEAVNASGSAVSEPSAAVSPSQPQAELVGSNWVDVAPQSGRILAGFERGSDGMFYYFGGVSNGGWTTSMVKYNPGSDGWTSAPSMTTSRESFASTADSNGVIYAIGGKTTLVEKYDPAVGSWESVPALPEALFDHKAAVDSAGRIYVAGGKSPNGSASYSVYRYNPDSSSWEVRASLPIGMTLHFMEMGPDGSVYALGSRSSTSSQVLRYNPALNSWSSVSDLGSRVNNPAGAIDAEGRIYSIGGQGTGGVNVKTVERFDPRTGTWSALPSLPVAKYSMAAAFDTNGKLYAVGGFDPNFEYDPRLLRLG